MAYTAHDFATNYHLWVMYVDPDNVLGYEETAFHVADYEYKLSLAQSVIDNNS